MKTVVRYEGITLGNLPKPGDIIFNPIKENLWLVLYGYEEPASHPNAYRIMCLNETDRKSVYIYQHNDSWCYFTRAQPQRG